MKFIALLSLSFAVIIGFLQSAFWDVKDFSQCEHIAPQFSPHPFDESKFSVRRLTQNQQTCFPSSVLRNQTFQPSGLPIYNNVLTITPLHATVDMVSFWKTYLPWINQFTEEGGIILLQKFPRDCLKRIQFESSGFGSLPFNTKLLPPYFLAATPHSHHLPYTMAIQCLENEGTERYGHTVFHNLRHAESLMSDVSKEKLYHFVFRNDTKLRLVNFPIHFASLSWHEYAGDGDIILNTSMMKPGYFFLNFFWFFRSGGYTFKMMDQISRTIDNWFVRGFIIRLLQSLAPLTLPSAINEPWEAEFWDAIWKSSVAIRNEPGDIILHNSWANPHSRAASMFDKKLNTVELYPCADIDPQTECGRSFDMEPYRDISSEGVEYVTDAKSTTQVQRKIMDSMSGVIKFLAPYCV